VVLRVNSPGGSGSASDAIWNAVRLTKAEKPVVVSMGDYAASGGYYISMGADRIYAQPGTLTGSIGVFGGKMNLAGLYAQVGVQLHTTQRGAYANLLSSTSDFTDAERAKFRTFLETFYDIFVEKAAEGRDMTRDELHAVAQGRVWTGAQALERGLVDELGGLDAAVAHAASLARERGAEADAEVRIVRFPERKGFVDQLIEELTGESQDAAARAAVASLPLPAARDTLAALSRLERVLADPAAALLPGDLTIQ
jgi:protease-4